MAYQKENEPLIISGLKVMRSAAGYYIGRTCEDPEMPGLEEPYSRESGYMAKEKAEAQLAADSFVVRECAENDYAYSTGVITRPKR